MRYGFDLNYAYHPAAPGRRRNPAEMVLLNFRSVNTSFPDYKVIKCERMCTWRFVCKDGKWEKRVSKGIYDRAGQFEAEKEEQRKVSTVYFFYYPELREIKVVEAFFLKKIPN